MKIVLRDDYKRQKDEIVLENVDYTLGKKLVLLMNNSKEIKVQGKFYQLVDDDFEI